MYVSLFIKRFEKYYKNKINTPTDNLCIEFIKNGETILNTSKENLFVERTHMMQQLPQQFDFIIYSVINYTHKNTPKIIFYNIPKKEELDNYEISSANILMTELGIQDKQLKVSFKGVDYNYFIVNNIFTSSFIYYFFKKHHSQESIGITKEQFDSSFQIKILDADINQIIVQHNESIKIQKDGLEVQKIEEELDYNIIN